MIDCSDSGRFSGFGTVLSRKYPSEGAGNEQEPQGKRAPGGGIRDLGLRVFFGQVLAIFLPRR